MFDIIENRKYEGKTGIYHFSNEGVCSWYDFTKMIAEYAGNTACDIQPCHSDEFPSPVKHPAYSVLDKTKVKETFEISIPYWTESLCDEWRLPEVLQKPIWKQITFSQKKNQTVRYKDTFGIKNSLRISCWTKKRT